MYLDKILRIGIPHNQDHSLYLSHEQYIVASHSWQLMRTFRNYSGSTHFLDDESACNKSSEMVVRLNHMYEVEIFLCKVPLADWCDETVPLAIVKVIKQWYVQLPLLILMKGVYFEHSWQMKPGIIILDESYIFTRYQNLSTSPHVALGVKLSKVRCQSILRFSKQDCVMRAWWGSSFPLIK